MSLTFLLLIPVLLIGLAVGSFLNVVIYRLPRDLSVARPRWSFCPHCRANIRWHDNVPVLGWLRLRARCRDCAAPISMQYPIVELLTGLLFVAVYDAVFIGRVVRGAGGAPGGAADGVLLVAWLFLLSTLLANALIDLEAYIIDVRLTYWGMAVGVACHALRPAPGAWAGLPDVRITAAALAMSLAVAATAWYAARRHRQMEAEQPPPPESPDAPGSADNPNAPTAIDAPTPLTAATRQGPLSVLLLTAVVLALAAAPFFGSPVPRMAASQAFSIRASVSLAVFCFVLILAAMQPRPADAEMAHTLEAERASARRVALGELGWLLPTIIAGVAAYLLVPDRIAADGWRAVFSEPGTLLPRILAGGSVGLIGLLSGAVLGWGVRIFFTLVFGKEAFGAGDIYLLAAIGAVGGPWVSLIAFFAACILALLGVAASLFRKSCRAIPFGPWLAVGTLVALWIETPVSTSVGAALETLWRILTGRPVDF